KNFDPKWHPTRNLINANHLLKEYRQFEEDANRRAAQRMSHQGEEASGVGQGSQSRDVPTHISHTEEPSNQGSQSQRSSSVDSCDDSMDDAWSQSSRSRKSSPSSSSRRSKNNAKKKGVKRASAACDENSRNVVVTTNIGKRKKYRGKMQQVVFLEMGSEESDAKVDTNNDKNINPTNYKDSCKSSNFNEDKKSNNDSFDDISNSDYDAWELPGDLPSPSSPPMEVDPKMTKKSSSTIVETTEESAKNIKSEDNLISSESFDVPMSTCPSSNFNKKNEPEDNDPWTEQSPKKQKTEIETRKKIAKKSFNLSHDSLEQSEQPDRLKSNNSSLSSLGHSGQLDEQTEMEICSKPRDTNKHLHAPPELQDNKQLEIQRTEKDYIPLSNLLEEQYESKSQIEKNLSATSRNSFGQNVPCTQETSKLMPQSTADVNNSSQFTLDIPLKQEEDPPKLKFSVKKQSGPFRYSFDVLGNQKEDLRSPEQIPQHVDTLAHLTDSIPDNIQQSQLRRGSQKVDGASMLTENASGQNMESVKKVTDEHPLQVEPSGRYHQFVEMIRNLTQLWMINMLPQAYAERLVDANDPENYPMFTMNAVEHNSTSKKNVEEENTLMKWNEIVGVIWLNKVEKLCWLRVCIDDISNSRYTQPSDQDLLSDFRFLSNETYHAVRLAILSNNYGALPDVCRNASNFAVFGPKDNFEVKEMIDACKGLKVNYDPSFSSDSIDLVLNEG
ncbi:3368_t:CDS:2, partial [Acaulospora colombiana]